LIDFAGAIVELYSFDAYGNAIGFDPSVALTEFLYSGEQFDSKIGQQYLRARYYDPTTSRFNRLDPFFGNLNDPQSLHKYLYTHADPVSYTDPSGNFIYPILMLLSTITAGASGMQLGKGWINNGNGVITTSDDKTTDANYTVFSNGGLPFLSGFSMEFNYTFDDIDGNKIRGNQYGYVQAEARDKTGKLRKKLSFVGNSGVKIGGFKGTEIAIFDVVGMVNMVGGLEAFKSLIKFNATGNPVTAEVTYNDIKYEGEELSRLMSGIKYGLKGSDFGRIYHIDDKGIIHPFNAVNPTIENFKELFEHNYKLFNGATKMKILYFGGNLEVYVGKPGETLTIKNLYYRDTGINIGDGKIYLQAHWGSGVQFSNITVKPYYE
jgi:RHS repeat-associated protein